jgi:exosortase
MSRRAKSKRKNNGRSNGDRAQKQGNSAQTQNARPASSKPAPIKPAWLWAGGLAMLAVFLWSYWPTLNRVVHAWSQQPDYSHGFLVLPIAIFFLWFRRQSFPGDEVRPAVLGGLMLVLAGALRIVAGTYFLEPLDAWTIPLWVAGTVWLMLGYRCLTWSLPSVIFLWFMFPIPYQAERWFSVPLQAVATNVSTACLLVLGQPALSEGNTIWLGDQQMFVEEACSGLRIFVGIFAFALPFQIIWNIKKSKIINIPYP